MRKVDLEQFLVEQGILAQNKRYGHRAVSRAAKLSVYCRDIYPGGIKLLRLTATASSVRCIPAVESLGRPDTPITVLVSYHNSSLGLLVS